MKTGSKHPINQSAANYPITATGMLVWIAGSLLGKSWRSKLVGRSDLNPYMHKDETRFIYCFWHEHLLPITYLFRGSGVTAVVSRSRDGMWVSAIASRWKHGIIAGSSSRGGAGAVRECVRSLQKGCHIAITPDGPRGPRNISKPGAAEISLLSGVTIVPVIVRVKEAWYLKSWDRFCIPKPFSKVVIDFCEPLYPKDFSQASDPVALLTEALSKALHTF